MILKVLKRALIVSCQARADNPLHGSVCMAAMAAAAAQGGAGGIRANGPDDIAAIRRAVPLPIIGIQKVARPGGGVVITPDFASAREVVEAGADIVALTASVHDHPDVGSLADLVGRIHAELAVPVMADCATLAEGVRAAQCGADLVATTLSGYTPDTRDRPAPDLELVRSLTRAQPQPVAAEGHIWTPEQAAAAFDAGAYAVVVGTAITNPREITARFVNAIRGRG